MDENRIEFLDATPRSDDDAEDVLAVGPDRRPWNRTRRAVTAATAAVVVLTLVWSHTQANPRQAAKPPTVTVPPSPPAGPSRSQTVPFATDPSSGINISLTVLPPYARLVSTTPAGDLLVQGTPRVVRRTLTAAFSVVNDVQVRTGFSDAGANRRTVNLTAHPFTSRLITARSGQYRVQVLLVRRTSREHPVTLHLAPSPPGSVVSFAEIRYSSYVIDVVVSGPASTSLIRLENSPRLLNGLIGDA